MDKIANAIKVPLYPAKDVPYELQIKALVGQKNRFVCLCVLFLKNLLYKYIIA